MLVKRKKKLDGKSNYKFVELYEAFVRVPFRETHILYSVLISNINFSKTTELLPFARLDENNINLVCVCVCVKPHKRKRVNLGRNENANLNLPCRPGLSVNITILHSASDKTAHNQPRCDWYKSLHQAISITHYKYINSPYCYVLSSCLSPVCLLISVIPQRVWIVFVFIPASPPCHPNRTFLSNEKKMLE